MQAASIAAAYAFPAVNPSQPVSGPMLTGLMIIAAGALIGGSLALLGFLRRETPWCWVAAAGAAGVWAMAWFRAR